LIVKLFGRDMLSVYQVIFLKREIMMLYKVSRTPNS
jgi:hypothetical protein